MAVINSGNWNMFPRDIPINIVKSCGSRVADSGYHSTAGPNLNVAGRLGRTVQLHVASYVGLVMPFNDKRASFPAPGIS